MNISRGVSLWNLRQYADRWRSPQRVLLRSWPGPTLLRRQKDQELKRRQARPAVQRCPSPWAGQPVSIFQIRPQLPARARHPPPDERDEHLSSTRRRACKATTNPRTRAPHRAQSLRASLL